MTTWAVDIGGTKIAVARVADDGTVEGEPLVVPTPGGGPEAVVAQVVASLAALDRDGVERVGISSAGVVDVERGVVLSATESIPGWAGTDLAGRVGRAVGLPVTALGDGHAFAVGEAVHGAARGHDTALVVAVGTGVGGSYVRGGLPLFGSHWAAGHVGHVVVRQAAGLRCYCGRTGHLEAIGSGAGMHRWYLAHGGPPDVVSARDVVARAEHDEVAARAVTLAGEALGEALAGLCNTLDPDVVVVAGGLSQAGPSWADAVRDAFAATLIPVLDGLPLLLSDAGAWLALRGAAHYARQRSEAA